MDSDPEIIGLDVPREVIERERRTRKAVKSIFRGEDGKAVLEELSRFCRADRTCFEVGPDGRFDPLRLAMLEGRREVYLHIMAFINSGEFIA